MEVFAGPITGLPEADIPLEGVKAYLSQETDHQILFMQFAVDTELAPHKHRAQAGFVVAGRIDLLIDGKKTSYTRGDSYFIPEDVVHSGKIYAGYADISYFAEKDRYPAKIIK